MNLTEAYALYLNNPDWDKQEYRVAVERAFAAGWGSKEEALKQTVLPLGGGMDYTSAETNPASPYTIWEHWPIKKARGAAIPAIAKAIKKRGALKLLQDVTDYAKAVSTWPEAEKQYIPMCSTWMNQERWLDDRSTWQRGNPVQASQFGRSH